MKSNNSKPVIKAEAILKVTTFIRVNAEGVNANEIVKTAKNADVTALLKNASMYASSAEVIGIDFKTGI